jgi:hypothetical protein
VNIEMNVAYFDRNKYPPSVADHDVKVVFDSLFKELFNASCDSGAKLTKQGSLSQSRQAKLKVEHMGTPCLKQFDIACYRCRKHREQRKKKAPPVSCLPTQSNEQPADKDTERETPTFRHSSLHGDKLNSRGWPGLKMARRTHTNCPLSCKQTCKFRFVVRLDQYGYYIERMGKKLLHTHHMFRVKKDVATGIHHTTAEERADYQKLSNAMLRPAIGRSFALANHSHMFTRAQMRWAFQKQDESGKLYCNGETIYKVSIVDWLKSKEEEGISYCIWGPTIPTQNRPSKLDWCSMKAQTRKANSQ